MKNWLIPGFLTLALFVTAQSDYGDFPDAEKEHVVSADIKHADFRRLFQCIDVFSNDDYGWCATVSYIGKRKGLNFDPLKKQFDLSRDFEIELGFKLKKGRIPADAANEENGLYFGDRDEAIVFTIINAKGWYFSQLKDNQLRTIAKDKAWTGYDRKNRSTLVLRKIDDQAYIFYNGALLHAGPLKVALPPGNNCGIAISGLNDVHVFKFRFSYLKSISKSSSFSFPIAASGHFDRGRLVAFPDGDRFKVFDIPANETIFETSAMRFIAASGSHGQPVIYYETADQLVALDLLRQKALFAGPKGVRYAYHNGLPYLFVKDKDYQADRKYQVYSLERHQLLFEVPGIADHIISPDKQHMVFSKYIKTDKNEIICYDLVTGAKKWSFKTRGSSLIPIPGDHGSFLLFDSGKHKMFGRISYASGKVQKMKKDAFFRLKTSLVFDNFEADYKLTEARPTVFFEDRDIEDHRIRFSDHGVSLQCPECPVDAQTLDIFLGSKPLAATFSPDYQYLAIRTESNDMVVQQLADGQLFKYADLGQGLLSFHWTDQNHLGLLTEHGDKRRIQYMTEFKASKFASDAEEAAKSGKCLKGDCVSGEGMFQNADGSITVGNFDDKGRPDGHTRIDFEDGSTEVIQYDKGVISGSHFRYDQNGRLLWGKAYTSNNVFAELSVGPEGSIITCKVDDPPGRYFANLMLEGPQPVTIHFPNGNTYAGTLTEKGRYDRGILKQKNGNVLKEGQFRGAYRYNTPSNYFNDGYRSGDCIEGNCTNGFGTSIHYQSDPYTVNYYIGEFANGKRHGQGKRYDPGDREYWDEGIYYEGKFIGTCVSGDCKNGTGKLLDPKKLIRYEGEFVGYKYHGTMKRYDMLRSRYIDDMTFTAGKKLGSCKSGDCQNGFGTMALAPANMIAVGAITYEGQFANGLPHGKGKVYFPYSLQRGDDPAFYEGDLVDGKMTGQGLRQYTSGQQHMGRFEDGKLTTRTGFTNLGGVTYEGTYSGDALNGNVEIKNKRGDWAKGTYKAGRKHGHFTIFQDGVQHSAEFVNDRLTVLDGQPAKEGNEGEYFIVEAQFSEKWGVGEDWPWAYYYILRVTNCDKITFDVYDVNFKSYFKGVQSGSAHYSYQVYHVPYGNVKGWMIENYPAYVHRNLGVQEHDCGRHVHWLDVFF